MLKLLVLISVVGSVFSTYCPKNQVWDDCGSACPPTCDTLYRKDIACLAVCIRGCRCTAGFITVKKTGGGIDCITRDKCPPPSCKAPLVWNNCGSACTVTCDKPVVKCTKQCAPRCQCPREAPLQDIDFFGKLRCTTKDKCCPKGKVWNSCGSACPPTCNPPPGPQICTRQCIIGCTCPKDKPIEITDDNGNFVKCISRDQCPPRKCTGGQIWKECGSACNTTCDQPVVLCTQQCVRRCECPHGLLQDVDIHGNIRCIKKSQCCEGEKVFNPCGSACPPKCNPPPGPQICTLQCVIGCTCPRHKPIEIKDNNGNFAKCIFKRECPPPKCSGGQIWKECGSACNRTCDQPVVACTRQCVRRCECPHGLLQDVGIFGQIRCINQKECCPGDLVYNSCGSSCPGPSCIPPKEPRFCPAVCVPGCTCPRDKPIQIRPGKCISRDECPKPMCPGNQVWNRCGSACNRTCDRPVVPCTKQCVTRCECPRDLPIQSVDKNGDILCIKEDQCCKGDLVFNPCGSACPPTCNPPKEPIACPAVCIPKCTCPRDRPIQTKPGVCIKSDQCPKPKCKGGQKWTKCGSACTPTCLKPNPICTRQCVRRCQCPRRKPIWHKNKCIKKKACRRKQPKKGKGGKGKKYDD